MSNGEAPAPADIIKEAVKVDAASASTGAVKAATALSRMLFGGCAVTMAAWCAQSLAWIGTNGACTLIVVTILLLSLGYGWQVVRCYRSTPHPPITNQVKVSGVMVWIAVLAGVFHTMFTQGAVAVSLVLIPTVYLFFVTMALLMALGNGWRRVLLAAGGALAGFLGWGMITYLVVESAQRVCGLAQPGQNGAEAASLVLKMMNALTPAGYVLLALVLIAATYLLRIEQFHRGCGVSRRKLIFTPVAIVAMALLGVAVIFTAISCNALQRKYVVALENAKIKFGIDFGQNSPVPNRQRLPEATQLAMIRLAQAWQADGVMEKVRAGELSWRECSVAPWVTPAAEKELSAAKSAMAKVDAGLVNHKKAYGELLAALPLPLVDKERYGVFGFELAKCFALYEIRLAAFNDDLAGAMEHWRELQRITAFVAAADPLMAVSGGYLDMWVDGCQVLLAMPQVEAATLQEVKAGMDSIKKCLVAEEVIPMGMWLKDLCNGLLVNRDESNRLDGVAPATIKAIFPFPWMLITGEMTQSLTLGAGAESYSQLIESTDKCTGFVLLMQLRWIAQTLQRRTINLSRIGALQIVTAAVEYRLDNAGAYPENAMALVPRYLQELPVDPLAPETPYTVNGEDYQELFLRIDKSHADLAPLPSLFQVCGAAAESRVVLRPMVMEKVPSVNTRKAKAVPES